jgi:hypothetical protein
MIVAPREIGAGARPGRRRGHQGRARGQARVGVPAASASNVRNAAARRHAAAANGRSPNRRGPLGVNCRHDLSSSSS